MLFCHILKGGEDAQSVCSNEGYSADGARSPS